MFFDFRNSWNVKKQKLFKSRLFCILIIFTILSYLMLFLVSENFLEWIQKKFGNFKFIPWALYNTICKLITVRFFGKSKHSEYIVLKIWKIYKVTWILKQKKNVEALSLKNWGKATTFRTLKMLKNKIFLKYVFSCFNAQDNSSLSY